MIFSFLELITKYNTPRTLQSPVSFLGNSAKHSHPCLVTSDKDHDLATSKHLAILEICVITRCEPASALLRN